MILVKEGSIDTLLLYLNSIESLGNEGHPQKVMESSCQVLKKSGATRLRSISARREAVETVTNPHNIFTK